MKPIVRIGKLFPAPIRHAVRDALKDRSLRKAIEPLRRSGRMTSDQVESFANAWGNVGFAADSDYLAQLTKMLDTTGPVLECGTGGTTLLSNAMGLRNNFRTYCLEQNPDWTVGTRRMLPKNSNVVILDTPLKHFGNYCWYDVKQILPMHFSLIVCDGPSIEKEHGEPIYSSWRYGILPWLKSTGRTFDALLLDDVNDPRGPAVINRWISEFNVVVNQVESLNGELAIVSPRPSALRA